MAIGAFVRGQQLRVQIAIKNGVGALVDPTGLLITVRDPAGGLTNKIYGTDAEVVKDGTGLYHIDVDGNAEGDWHVRWEGSGVNKGAGEGLFRVLDGVFA